MQSKWVTSMECLCSIPPLAEQAESDLEITIAGTKDAVTMVEAAANEVSEQVVLDAIAFGHEAIKELCALQEEIREQIGKEKAEVPVFQPEVDLDRWVREHVYEDLVQALRASEKLERKGSWMKCSPVPTKPTRNSSEKSSTKNRASSSMPSSTPYLRKKCAGPLPKTS